MEKFELFQCFQDGMVLQRDSRVKVWGFTKGRERITCDFLDKQYEATFNEDGDFEFLVETGQAGGPFEMVVRCGEYVKRITDILLGDVYLISGQSNMELPMLRTIDLVGDRLDDLYNDQVREFRIPQQIAFGKQEKQYMGGCWYKADKEDILKMSATGFHFALDLQKELGVPIAVVNCAIGGTPIEAHLPEEILLPYNKYTEEITQCKDEGYVQHEEEKEKEAMDNWFTLLAQRDTDYSSENIDDSLWETMELPRHFSGTNLESFQGSIWFRRTFVIPQGYLLEDALLRVGTLVDADTVYINGTEVGHVDYMYPPRRYPLPSGVLRYGENTIAVCLVSHRETGAFTEGKKYCIQGKEAIFEGGYRVESGDLMDPKPEDGKWEIDLSGQWKYKTAAVMSPLPEQTFFQYKPTAIYNGMMHPLLRYKIKGALWYQGESNESNALEYMELLTHLVKCWRTWFGENLPFICVQLPQFYDPTMGLRKNAWAELREQQRQILLLPNTGLAVTIDVGEGNDLHPQTKEAVGKRLALIARAIIYGHNIEYSGPNLVYVEYNSKDGELMLRFEHCEDGIEVHGENTYFELGYDGADGEVEWRKYEGSIAVEGSEVRLQLIDEARPRIVRYAYDNCPEHPPLFNHAGLPASPFVEVIH